jgi:hypothetical protein
MRDVWLLVAPLVLACTVPCTSGCDESRPPTPTTATSATVTPAASSAPAATAPGPSPAASAPRAKTCEVEIFGNILVPKEAPKGKLVVYVAQDDCMDDKAHMLGHIPAQQASASFAIEVFSGWATDITICAALEAEDGSSQYYGKAVNKENGGKFHTEAEGEVTFNQLKISLTKGPTHTFPREPR